MSKKKLQAVPAPVRTPEEVTRDYQTLCIELGNAVLNFEVVKSQYLAKFQNLHAEMQAAQKAHPPQPLSLADKLGVTDDK